MWFGKIFARRFKECLKALNAGEVDDSDEDAGPRKRVQGIFDKFLDTDDDVFFGKKIKPYFIGLRKNGKKNFTLPKAIERKLWPDLVTDRPMEKSGGKRSSPVASCSVVPDKKPKFAGISDNGSEFHKLVIIDDDSAVA